MRELLAKFVALIEETTALVREERKRRNNPYQQWFGQQGGSQSLSQQSIYAYQNQQRDKS